MRRRIAAILVALSMLVAGSGLAASPANASLPYVMPIVQSYWQTHYYWPPPCGGINVVEVAWGGPPSVGGYADASTCSMYINNYYSGVAGFICMLETHEAGHLLGLGHDNNAEWWDPSDIMKSTIDYNPTSVVSPCRW